MKEEARIGRILLIIGRVALGALFIYAAYAKMKPLANLHWSVGAVRISLGMFAMQVDSFGLLPPWAVHFIAYALPPFELFLGLWLVTGILLRYSSLVTTLLLAGFFGVLIHAYALGQEISCGCFGPGEHIGPERLLIESCFFALSLAVTIGAFVAHRRRPVALPEAFPVESR